MSRKSTARPWLPSMILVASGLSVSTFAQPPVLGPAASQGAEVAAFIAERVTRARLGHRDVVRLPLVFQSDGWGCSCPTNYVGVDPGAHDGGETWLEVENISGEEFPPAPSRSISDVDGNTIQVSEGMVVRVDGYFTGEVIRADYDGEDYNTSQFRVTRIHQRMRTPGRARVATLSTSEEGVCPRVVNDATPLNVRSHPRAGASVVGALQPGSTLVPTRWHRHRWVRIEGEITGWVWVDSTRRACDGVSAGFVRRRRPPQ